MGNFAFALEASNDDKLLDLHSILFFKGMQWKKPLFEKNKNKKSPQGYSPITNCRRKPSGKNPAGIIVVALPASNDDK